MSSGDDGQRMKLVYQKYGKAIAQELLKGKGEADVAGLLVQKKGVDAEMATRVVLHVAERLEAKGQYQRGGSEDSGAWSSGSEGEYAIGDVPDEVRESRAEAMTRYEPQEDSLAQERREYQRKQGCLMGMMILILMPFGLFCLLLGAVGVIAVVLQLVTGGGLMDGRGKMPDWAFTLVPFVALLIGYFVVIKGGRKLIALRADGAKLTKREWLGFFFKLAFEVLKR